MVIGALIGLLDLTGYILISATFRPLSSGFLEAVVVVFLGQTLLFTFSNYFGSSLAKRMKLIPLSEDGSDRVAIALARITHKTNSNNAKDIEFWKTILASLTPIFTLVGTIVTAYFTYLAAFD